MWSWWIMGGGEVKVDQWDVVMVNQEGEVKVDQWDVVMEDQGGG